MAHIFKCINRNRLTIAGCAIHCFQTLRTLGKNWKQRLLKRGRGRGWNLKMSNRTPPPPWYATIWRPWKEKLNEGKQNLQPLRPRWRYKTFWYFATYSNLNCGTVHIFSLKSFNLNFSFNNYIKDKSVCPIRSCIQVTIMFEH